MTFARSRSIRLAAAIALATALSACSTGPRGPSDTVIARALQGAPGEAQPSNVVATEIAYARTAREDGWVAAANAFASPAAVIHGRNGPVPFAVIARDPGDATATSEWGPRVVVISCDGALALSQGRFRDPEGLVGDYVTVWERQRDNSYRWSYDVAGLDNPQPTPRPEPAEGDIVVTALDAVNGLVASCPDDGAAVPPPPALESPSLTAEISRDGTLRWAWEHLADDRKRVLADYYHEGEWVRAIAETLASPDEAE
ncbi:hypothetical protein [Erythrobacter sp.]|uniref:hypothetical protein n=1 Tax=Erythrobacter sp. TaxID=1042 RepID=UPI003C74EC82